MSSDPTKPVAITRKRTHSSARSPSLMDTLKLPLLVWIVHWLITQVPATVVHLFGTSRAYNPTCIEHRGVDDCNPAWAYGIDPGPMSGLADWLVAPMRHWDGSWYRMIALDGYDPLGDHPAKAAFWPLYPWLMDLGNQLTGLSAETIGYIIANLAFLAALIVLYRLVQLDFSEPVARRTLWTLAVFPMTFFFTAVYTESLFLLLAVAGLYAARRGNWLAAGIIGLLAALSRSQGIMILAPYAVLFLQQFGWNPRAWFPNALPAALPALGPLIFGWHLTTVGMNFLAFVDVQLDWNRYPATPLHTLRCAIAGCTTELPDRGTVVTTPGASSDWITTLLTSPTWSTITSFEWRESFTNARFWELAITILAFALAAIGLRKLPLYYSAYLLPPLLFPLFSPSQVNALMSMPRFVLPLFPLFVVVALLISGRREGIALAVISAIFAAAMSMQFAHWYWVS